MTDPTPPIQTLDAATIRQQWTAVVEQVARQHSRVLVEEDGIAVAAIVPMADLQRLAQLDEQRKQFLDALDRSQEAFADVPDDELAEEIDKALAAVRAAAPGPTER